MPSREAPATTLRERLVRAWYRPRLTPATLCLTPLAAVFGLVSDLRRRAFRRGWRRVERLPVPTVVVGNIAVGGTGKTPLVIALARALAARGWQPGVISRGVGSAARDGSRVVAAGDAADVIGDEPALIARAGIPVAIGARRVDAGRALLAAHPECDVVLSDDGLQHYALARDMEIAVIDGVRGLGNGWRLPAGPLREPPARLADVDAVVVNGAPDDHATYRADAVAMGLRGDTFVAVRDASRTATASQFAGKKVHAIAGIGHPARFFESLRRLGVVATPHAFADHHRFVPADLDLPGADVILMTEKDAVKCEPFADARCWMLPVTGTVDESLFERVSAAVAAAARGRAVPRR